MLRSSSTIRFKASIEADANDGVVGVAQLVGVVTRPLASRDESTDSTSSSLDTSKRSFFLASSFFAFFDFFPLDLKGVSLRNFFLVLGASSLL